MAIDEDITLKRLEVLQSFMMLSNTGRVPEVFRQSTVSVHHALHSLGEGLRCPLLKRDGCKLIPLSTAYVLAEHVEWVLAECEADVRRAHKAAGFSSTTLKIGGLYSMTVGTLSYTFAGLKMHYPTLDIELTLGSNRSLLVKLESGQFDVITIALGELLHNLDLLTVPMFDNGILFTVPLDPPYAPSAKAGLQTIYNEKFVALGDGFAAYHDLIVALDKAGFAPQIVLHMSDIFSLMNLVSGGIGYALLPRRMAGFNLKVQLIPLTACYAINQHTVLVIQYNQERDPSLFTLSAECRLLGAQ